MSREPCSEPSLRQKVSNTWIIVEKVPGHNEVSHKDNLLTEFQWFRQFGMLLHLLQRQPNT